MLSRRGFTTALGAACLCRLCGYSSAQEVVEVSEKDEFFFCATPQITQVAQTVVNTMAAGPGEVVVDDMTGGPSGGQIVINDYATAQRTLRWKKSDGIPTAEKLVVLGVAFLDGDQWQKDAVRTFASDWLKHDINIDFVFDNPSKRHIRITFNSAGNQSKTGREGWSPSASGATMQLGSVARGQPESVIRRVSLHEFGHGAMTMGHEHKRPDTGFQWNIDAIMRDTGWSRQKIVTNITSVYDTTRSCGQYDPKSIMHYSINPDWISGGMPVRQSTVLSPSDVDCAKRLYADVS